jgi:hypothetical protein
VLPLHHGFPSGRPGSNGPPRGGAPVLFPLSYVREVVRPAGFEPAAPAVAGQCSAPLSYGRVEPPAGVEPAPRPYKGRVLAVDATEANWSRRDSNPRLPATSGGSNRRDACCGPMSVETAGVEPAPPRCKRGARPSELHPQRATEMPGRRQGRPSICVIRCSTASTTVCPAARAAPTRCRLSRTTYTSP